MASKFKIIQNIQTLLKENGIDAPLENISVSVTLPEIIHEDADTVCFEKKLIIVVKQYHTEKKMKEGAWKEYGWGKNI